MSDINLMVSRQVKRWNLEWALYEERKEEQSSETVRPADERPVVTVSRQRGCRGHELAKLVAHDLKYGLFDRKIVDYIVRHMGVRSELVESLDERDRSELELWINGILKQHVFDHDEYIKALGEAVKTTALQGSVVIIGRGSNFLLAGTPAFHVRVVAPDEFRIRNLCQLEGMSESKALQELKKVDSERAGFIQRYFDRSIDDPTAYDLILNSGTSTLDGMVKVIRSALLARGWPLEITGGDKRKRME